MPFTWNKCKLVKDQISTTKTFLGEIECDKDTIIRIYWKAEWNNPSSKTWSSSLNKDKKGSSTNIEEAHLKMKKNIDYEVLKKSLPCQWCMQITSLRCLTPIRESSMIPLGVIQERFPSRNSSTGDSKYKV